MSDAAIPSQVTLESAPCPMGCPAGDEPVITGRDRIHDLPGRFSVVRCATCGLMRTDPRPTLETIGYYYPSDYAPHQTATPGRSGEPGLKAGLKRLYQRVFTTLAEAVPDMPPGRLLELGCGGGHFLGVMAGRGWSVEGLEPSAGPTAALRAMGFDIHCCLLTDFPGPSRPVDMIAAWMVLEHLHDPGAALEAMRGWLKPGGFLVFSVPDEGAAVARFFGNAWYNLQLPQHLYHFSRATLKALLEKHGWRIRRTINQRTLSSVLPSLANLAQDKGRDPGAWDRLSSFCTQHVVGHALSYPVGCLLALAGQTGRLTVWAQPAGEGE